MSIENITQELPADASSRRLARLVILEIHDGDVIKSAYDSLIDECQASQSRAPFFCFIDAVLRVLSLLINPDLRIGIFPSQRQFTAFAADGN